MYVLDLGQYGDQKIALKVGLHWGKKSNHWLKRHTVV